jgi:hypothetical protein
LALEIMIFLVILSEVPVFGTESKNLPRSMVIAGRRQEISPVAALPSLSRNDVVSEL